MSRIGKLPVKILPGVKVALADGLIKVTGPKGELTQVIHPQIKVELKDDQITVTVKNPEDKDDRSLWGLFRALINNMVVGVTKGYEKKLEINGVGYKASVTGRKLILNVGFTHPVEFAIPDQIEIKVEKNVITITGADKQKVGQVAAEIRAVRKPEPYKGKGIKYLEEIIRRKAGKSAKTGPDAGAK
ncbi:MAG: 50S ribosomal protein L6 [Patescibacteria group bacterium]